MKDYINRHKDEDVLELLTNMRNVITYSCSDPRMHSRAESSVAKYIQLAIERHHKEFTELEGLISDYIGEHACIPFCVVPHLLAMSYLGGLISTEDIDQEHPYRS